MNATEIEDFYKTRLRPGPFPYKDCRWLAQHTNIESGELIPALDTYFADVAGFCSSASRLADRPREQLRRGKRWIAMSFFEKHPEFKHLEALINADRTPNLYARIRDTELARLSLLDLLEQIATE